MKKVLIFLTFLLLFSASIFCETASIKIFTLKDSVKFSLENNLDMKRSSEKILQKQWEKEEARTKFLPVISGSFSYTRLDKVPSISIPGFPMKIEMGKNDIYNAKLTLTQPIFTGGALQSQYQIKKEEINIAEGEKTLTQQEIAFKVIQAYFSILKIHNFLQAANTLVEQRENHLSNVKKLFDAGLATKADILKTEVALADAIYKKVETENMLNLAKENFKTILNLSSDAEINLEDTLTITQNEKDLETWKETAIKEREELKQFDRSLEILENTKKIFKSEYYPNIAFVFSLQGEKGTSSGLHSWYQNLSGLLVASIDIWNWQSTKKKLNSVESQISQTKIQKQNIINLISLEITSAYLNLQSAKEKIKVMERAVEDAKENVRVTELLRREGLATTTDVIDAQTYLYQIKAGYYQALYDYQLAHYNLLKSSGILVEKILAEK